MKNKIILSMFVLVMMSASFSAVHASGITALANLKVTFVSQTPDPVEPGKVVEIRWKIENIGSAAAEDVMFELLPEYPFSLY